MIKISREKWLEAGLIHLTQSGAQSLRIELLCQQLNVTKGSFYHHFRNLESYQRDLLTYWENTQPANALEWLGAALRTEERINIPSERKVRIIMGAENAIRIWAASFIPARQALLRVDQARLNTLQQQYIERGLATRKALDMARLKYFGLTGIPFMYAHLPKAEQESLAEMFFRNLGEK